MRGLLVAALLLGACATPTRRPPDLEAGYRRIEAAPKQADGYLDLARAYLRRGDLLRARQYLTLGERAAGGDTEAAFRLGVVIAVRSGLHDDAIQRCRARLERVEDPSARRLLAALLEAQGRLGEAELQWRLLDSMAPGDQHLLVEMARFYQRSGRPGGEARAAELYRRYLAAQPEGTDAPVARAALRVLSLQAAPGDSDSTNERPGSSEHGLGL